MPWQAIQQDSAKQIIDHPVAVNCPHCGTRSNLTAISTPRWEQVSRYDTSELIVGYRCDACNRAVALRYEVTAREIGNYRVYFSDQFSELERAMETFDYKYLPEQVAADFREALTCYSHQCLNAAAAMCRRTIQSAATALGAAGTDRVSSQILEIKETAGIDDITYDAIKQAMLTGHDGAHPHLPTISPQRAAVLVVVMKDVLHQLFVRQARAKEAMQLRTDAVAEKRSGG